MGPIGKNTPLVELLFQKTKVKKEDIIDILKQLPECMAEAFLMSNPPEKKHIEVGGIAISWHSSKVKDPWIALKLAKAFKIHFSRLKNEKKYPLAKILSSKSE